MPQFQLHDQLTFSFFYIFDLYFLHFFYFFILSDLETQTDFFFLLFLAPRKKIQILISFFTAFFNRQFKLSGRSEDNPKETLTVSLASELQE